MSITHRTLFLWIGVILSYAPNPSNSIASDYTSHIVAMQKYQNREYTEAFKLLKEVLQKIPNSPPEVYWNAGSSAFFSERFSEAALYWEASLRRGLWSLSAPGWIVTARKKFSHSVHSIEPTALDYMVTTLFPWSLWFALLISGLLATAGSRIEPIRWPAFVLSGIFLLVGFTSSWARRYPLGIAIKAGVQLHSAPRDDASQLAQLSEGDRLLVLESQGEWLKVKSKTGAELWTKISDLILVQ